MVEGGGSRFGWVERGGGFWWVWEARLETLDDARKWRQPGAPAAAPCSTPRPCSSSARPGTPSSSSQAQPPLPPNNNSNNNSSQTAATTAAAATPRAGVEPAVGVHHLRRHPLPLVVAAEEAGAAQQHLAAGAGAVQGVVAHLAHALQPQLGAGHHGAHGGCAAAGWGGVEGFWGRREERAG